MTERKGFSHEFKFDADGIGCAEGLDCKARDRLFLLELLIGAVGETEDAISISDSFGTHIYHNKAFERLFGCTTPQLSSAGGFPALLKNPEKAEGIFESLRAGRAWTGEIEAGDLQGKRSFTALLRANPIRDRGGAVIGSICIYTDISERKRKEETLKLHRDLLMELVEERTAEIEEANAKLQGEIAARKAAQEKLEAERALLLGGPLAVLEWRLHPSPTIEYVSANFAQFFGFPPERLLSGGLRFEDLIHPDDLAFYAESRARLSSSPFFAIEYRLKGPRGKEIWVYEFTRVARDEKGEPARLDSYLLDVTDRVSAERALRAERDRTQSYLDLAGTIFLVLGCDRKVKLINRKGCDTLGFKEHDILGKDWFDKFVPASHRRKAAKSFEDMVSGRSIPSDVPCEGLVKSSGGGERIVHWRFSLLKDKQGEVGGLLACGEDVTEGKRAQEELKGTSELLKNLLRNSGAAILAIDSHSRPRSLNPAAEKLFGWTLEKLANDEGEASFELLSTLKKISSESPGVSVRVSLPSKGGSNIDVAATSIPCRLDDGKPGAICMVTDVSQELALERHLRQTQKMEALGLLAGGIAHDFNNILSAIIGYTDLALLQSSQGPQLKAHLEQVAIAGRRARELVGQILAFCRKSDKAPEPLDASMIVKEALKMLRATLPPSISIKESRRDGGEMIMADPAQMHQLVSNLCTNAAHAMREKGGTILVSLSVRDAAEGDALPEDILPGRYLELSVSDRGHGIAPEILDRIFDPFFTTKRPGEGTGMGLSVVHGIVSDLKGKISVESEAGKGSTFRILMPSAKRRSKTGRSKLSEARKGSERLLVVDDESVLSTMMAEMLGDLGYDVKAFSDPLAALDAFKLRPGDFDLLLTDQVMPRLTGSQLAIEAMKIKPEMPVILLTGYGDRFTREQALGVGIKRHLLKPVSMEELASAIHETVHEGAKDKDA